MVFVANHSRTLGAHYANSDRLIRNEVLFLCKKTSSLSKTYNFFLPFPPSEFFSSGNWQHRESLVRSSSKLAKHEVSCKMAMI